MLHPKHFKLLWQKTQIYDGGAAAKSKQNNETTVTENTESRTRPVDYHRQAPVTEDSDTPDIDDSSTGQRKDITEEDIENFLSKEKFTAGEREQMHKEAVSEFKPEIGMEFATREEVQKFFNMYSYVVGFSVSCVSIYRTTSKKRNNEIIRFTMKCNKYGKNLERSEEHTV